MPAKRERILELFHRLERNAFLRGQQPCPGKRSPEACRILDGLNSELAALHTELDVLITELEVMG